MVSRPIGLVVHHIFISPWQQCLWCWSPDHTPALLLSEPTVSNMQHSLSSDSADLENKYFIYSALIGQELLYCSLIGWKLLHSAECSLYCTLIGWILCILCSDWLLTRGQEVDQLRDQRAEVSVSWSKHVELLEAGDCLSMDWSRSWWHDGAGQQHCWPRPAAESVR